MWTHRKIKTRVLSALAASAVAGTQIFAAMPLHAIAAETDNQTELAKSGSAVNYGDVNGDGIIDKVDAGLIEKFVISCDDTSIDLAAADVDSNGELDLRDAEIILNYYAAASAGKADDFKFPYTGNIEWKYYSGSVSYEIINEGMTWQEAEAYCESKGGHLAVITSAYEQARIEALLSAQSEIKNNYWIGLKKNDDGEFNWVTGEKADYTNWNPNTPNNSNGNQNTVFIYGNEFKSFGGQIGKWDDINESAESPGETFFGTENFGFVLEKDGKTVDSTTTTTDTISETTTTSETTSATTSDTTSESTTTTTTTESTTTTTTTTAPALPDIRKYEVIKEYLSWADAEAYCRSINGHLAVITSPEEQTQITNVLANAGANDCWIGGTRDKNGVFCWLNGEPIRYTNWASGEPNNLGGHENCIHTYSSGQWNDLPEGYTKWFICEWENVSDKPADLDSSEPTRLNINGELKVTPMTKQQVIDAGIDISGDDNFNSFQYTIEADFDAAGVVIDKIVSYDTAGTPVRDHVVINVAGCSGVVVSTNTPTYVPGLGAYVVRTETVEEEMYMIIYGKSKWLKEFYDVQLIVVNNDKKTLNDCTATLNIPEGLTLCKGDKTQDFGDLKPNEVKTADWYLRGDKEGDYDLTAVFSGLNGGEQFDYTFKSKDTLHVYSASALKMIVELPRYSYYDELYKIKIKLENVSDKPIYDLENVITRLEQGSDATLYRSRGNGELKPVADKHMDIFSKNDVASISVDELAPGESAVIELNVKDLWKSVYEQYIGRESRNAHIYSTLLASSRRPELLGYYWYNRFYEEALGELPVEHILKSVSVNFAGSDMTVPYEINIIDNGTASTSGVHFLYTNSAYTTLSQAFFRDRTDPRATYTYYRNNYIIAPFAIASTTNHSSYTSTGFGDYLDSVLGRGRGHVCLIRPVSIFTVNTPSPEVTATVYVEEADGSMKPAPSETASQADSKIFELEEMTGIEPDTDGKITITGETAIKLISNKAGKNGILHIDYSDGTKEEIKLLSVEDHECSSTSGYTLIDAPQGGQSGLAVKVCDICGDVVDSININSQAAAMLSNGKTYADIRVAVEDAVKAGEKTELTIFGNVTVTADVTIPDYVDVIIAPDTAITVKDGSKLAAKGEVKDFSGKKYNLSGDGPLVETTTETTTSTDTTDSTTTTAITSSTTGEGSSLPETGYPVSFAMIASIAALMTAAGSALVIRSKREEE